MTTRLAIILSLIWTLLIVAGCGGSFWFVMTQVPQSQQKQRAQAFGSGMATLASLGYAGIWLPWAAAAGRKRRQQRAEADARRKEAKDERRRRKRPVDDDE